VLTDAKKPYAHQVMNPDLDQISRQPEGRIDVELSDSVTLTCLETVRRVPGKRIVCRGAWGNQSVYAKLFIGNQAKRYFSRDLHGVQALKQAGIMTPDLLYSGQIVDGQGEVLIFAEVIDSVNAERAWEDWLYKPEARFGLAKKLVEEVAQHHQAGLLQTDLYLKNFLLQGERIYTLDGDAVRRISPFFGRHQTLENLTLLLSKFDVSDDALWLPELLAIYAKARGLTYAFNFQSVCKSVYAHRRRAASQYAGEKVFRECSDVHVKKNSRIFLAIARPYLNEKMTYALDEPDSLLDAAHRLKSGNTCTVSMAEVDGRKVVVKRYNIKNFWHGLSRALRPTRAAVSWSNAHRLIMYGIATAAPIALLEKRYGIIRRQAYFLAEYIGAPDADEFFADVEVTDAQKSLVAQNIAQLFYKLYLLKIDHGDFKATNMKIVDDKPVLIDLDSMREYRCNWWYSRRHVRDLRRFMRNWQHDATARSILVAAFRATYSDTSLLDKAGIVIL